MSINFSSNSQHIHHVHKYTQTQFLQITSLRCLHLITTVSFIKNKSLLTINHINLSISQYNTAESLKNA